MMYPSRSIHRGFDSLAGLNEATSTTKDNSVPRYQRAISHLSHSRVAANFRGVHALSAHHLYFGHC